MSEYFWGKMYVARLHARRLPKPVEEPVTVYIISERPPWTVKRSLRLTEPHSRRLGGHDFGTVRLEGKKSLQ